MSVIRNLLIERYVNVFSIEEKVMYGKEGQRIE